VKSRRPREDLQANVPRGAGGTSVYARTRARAALVRRRRVTNLIKTRSFMRGDIEGASWPVNIAHTRQKRLIAELRAAVLQVPGLTTDGVARSLL
jgi:hypothetical protein